MITENDSLRRAASYTVADVNIVLISTYELGRQPFGLASPAAWLRKRGYEVSCLDLSRQSLDETAVRGAGLIAIYLPMHTATRLAAKLIPTLREWNPRAHLCCYGLYAPMNADYLRTLGVTAILGGEFEQELVNLAERLQGLDRGEASPQSEPLVSLERLSFEVPDRTGLCRRLVSTLISFFPAAAFASSVPRRPAGAANISAVIARLFRFTKAYFVLLAATSFCRTSASKSPPARSTFPSVIRISSTAFATRLS